MKTKPDALASRIKRIMQADEDVGKISQATPVLIGRWAPKQVLLVFIQFYIWSCWLGG